MIRVLIVALSMMTGCAAYEPIGDARPWAGRDIGEFPYHPLVYHLDLSILTYQLYSQSLVWPFDPYYEEINIKRGSRERYMTKVKSWARVTGQEQLQTSAGLSAYRGPGVLNGFEDNAGHDPVLYQYDRIHPWSSSLTNPLDEWTEYVTPGEITARIKDVYVCYRTAAQPESSVSVEQLMPASDDIATDATDTLLVFEGGTGDKGESGQPASQSIMGFVLVREKDDGGFDLHIAFRGSRSGSGARAMWQAFSDENAVGNPDWITDMGFDRVTAGLGAEHITAISAVHRGFARSMKSIFPRVFGCLDKVASIKIGVIPDNIYVTGHSLGGALAQHFVSAILLGNLYGPAGAGKAMPVTLASWPWTNIKLITYSAPLAGHQRWARVLTKSGLQSRFFATALDPYDRRALAATNSDIVSRLLDSSRPVGYRVLISNDPITSEKVGGGGRHVGQTVYVNTPSALDTVRPPDVEAHEPANIRRYMFDKLADPRTPTASWRDHAMRDLNPGRNEEAAGGIEELRKLAAAIKNYYLDHDIWFDHAAFERNVELRIGIDRSQ